MAAVATVEVAGNPAATAVEVTVAARSATATTDAARRPGRDVLLLDTCGKDREGMLKMEVGVTGSGFEVRGSGFGV